MEGYCPFNQKMSMMKMSTCWKWHSDENLINDEKGRWWVKGKKKEKQNQQETRKGRRKKKKEDERKKERIPSEQRRVSDPPKVVDAQSCAVSDVP